MSSYKELSAQIEKLTKQAEVARNKEIAAVVAQIHGMMESYGITGADLGIKSSLAKRKSGSVAAKYQDPATGATWSGRGRAPAWIHGKDRSKLAV